MLSRTKLKANTDRLIVCSQAKRMCRIIIPLQALSGADALAPGEREEMKKALRRNCRLTLSRLICIPAFACPISTTTNTRRDGVGDGRVVVIIYVTEHNFRSRKSRISLPVSQPEFKFIDRRRHFYRVAARYYYCRCVCPPAEPEREA